MERMLLRSNKVNKNAFRRLTKALTEESLRVLREYDGLMLSGPEGEGGLRGKFSDFVRSTADFARAPGAVPSVEMVVSVVASAVAAE